VEDLVTQAQLMDKQAALVRERMIPMQWLDIMAASTDAVHRACSAADQGLIKPMKFDY
jgi:hypothetical protein